MTNTKGQQRETFSGYYDRPVYDALFRWIDIGKVNLGLSMYAVAVK